MLKYVGLAYLGLSIGFALQVITDYPYDWFRVMLAIKENGLHSLVMLNLLCAIFILGGLVAIRALFG
jgi:hypothetical protein